MNWLKYSSPQTFYPLAGKLVPWFAIASLLLCLYGLFQGLLVAPTDFQQGDSYRIIFVHVPASILSMFLYLVMAAYAILGISLNARLSYMMASSIAPTGAMFTFIALFTGSFWGKPTWGTWWVWDARITSELILLFLYIGYMSLQAAIDDKRRSDRASAVLAIVGVINVPIIYFSVKWWNTLHQGSTINFSKESSMAPVMLQAMLIMMVAFWFYSIAVILTRVRREIEAREYQSSRSIEANE